MFVPVLIVCITIILLSIFCLLRRKRQLDPRIRLPPGNRGFPIIGETLAFAKKKVEFFRERHHQYGHIFRTHLFGKPMIRIMGSENLRKVFLGENRIVKSSYPDSVSKLLGPNALTMSHGDDHKQRKQQLLQFFSREFLENHTCVFREVIVQRLEKWCSLPSINLHNECRLLLVELTARFLVNIDLPDATLAEIKKLLDTISNNLFVLPIYIPGTGYYKAFQAKNRVKEIFQETLREGFQTKGLSSVLESFGASFDNLDTDNTETLLDSIFELMWSGSESISTAGFTLVYLLTKQPKYLARLRRDVLMEERHEVEDECLKEAHVKRSYADAIVMETLRLLPPVGGVFREALQDFELEGYTIPKGWTISVSIRETQQNDDSMTSDPMSFCPERWFQKPPNGEPIPYFPFGGGARLCPGNAFAKLVLSILTTELALRCDIEVVKDSELTLWPSAKPVSDFIVSFRHADTTSISHRRQYRRLSNG
ncbi:hypothetical protein CHS0354_017687 [Potamilus streckersoni]|uniref:Cytochrome P450 n=1 Tax=Potamilus streckersoni TaxID=2493646 RepID=A0AAE0VS06_9BIVA|nr:hypothetical protein CHS0354_017687 [Potamilus streckersoni]